MASNFDGSNFSDSVYSGSDEFVELFCQRCIDHGDVKDADEYCLDCDGYLCKACIAKHRRNPKTDTHTIVGTDEAQDMKRASETCTVKVKHDRDIDVLPNKSSSDKGYCHISGLEMLSNNELLIIDKTNEKLKLLNLWFKTVKSELDIAGGPFDVTATGYTQVAVLLSSSIKFVKVGLLLRKLEDAGRQVTLDGQCKSIRYKNNQLFVVFTNPCKVEILNLNGTVLKRIVKGRDFFKAPGNLELSLEGTTLYIPDKTHGVVFALALDGTVKSRFNCRFPTSAAVDKQGRLLLTHADKKVTLLTPRCIRLKELANDLHGIRSLAYCRNTNRICVGFSDRGIISVYQLSE